MKAHHYSEAVYQSLKEGVSPDDALVRLKKTLLERGHIKLLRQVLSLLLLALAKERMRHTAYVRVAKKGAETQYEKDIEAFMQSHNLTSYTVVVDPTIVGGFSVETREVKHDRSYKTLLARVYASLAR